MIKKRRKRGIIIKRRRKILIIGILFIYYFFNNISVSAEKLPSIARWYNNHDAAVSLRFDDAHESHVEFVIPLLNEFNFKATFMVIPKRRSYLKYKDFWEKEVPQMGHSLGNHTMHHRGAKNLEEAEYEIGEASKIIWDLYPQESKLLVFASGGGKKWGGAYWESASSEYKDIVEKYHMIDLYDGRHKSFRGDAEKTSERLCKRIDQAIQENKHQPFYFHTVGEKDFIEKIKTYLRSSDISFSKEKFREFLQCVDNMRNKVWVAPLVQILKYEEEYNNAQLEILESNKDIMNMKLTVRTDPALYDQKITLIVPGKYHTALKRVYQNNEQIKDIISTSHNILINVEPKNSAIRIEL